MVFDDLAFGVSHDVFEQALSDLASIIGFQSQRPDLEIGRGPDVLWRMTNGHYLVIEAKNQVDSERQYIFKKEAEQLDHHVTWFEQEYPDGAHTAILIHPSATLYDDAYIPVGSKVIQRDNLQQIVESVRTLVVALASKPSDQWAVSDIEMHLQTCRLRPTDLLSQGLGKRAVRRKA